MFRREARSTLRQQTSAETAQEPQTLQLLFIELDAKFLQLPTFPQWQKFPLKISESGSVGSNQLLLITHHTPPKKIINIVHNFLNF